MPSAARFDLHAVHLTALGHHLPSDLRPPRSTPFLPCIVASSLRLTIFTPTRPNDLRSASRPLQNSPRTSSDRHPNTPVARSRSSCLNFTLCPSLSFTLHHDPRFTPTPIASLCPRNTPAPHTLLLPRLTSRYPSLIPTPGLSPLSSFFFFSSRPLSLLASLPLPCPPFAPHAFTLHDPPSFDVAHHLCCTGLRDECNKIRMRNGALRVLLFLLLLSPRPLGLPLPPLKLVIVQVRPRLARDGHAPVRGVRAGSRGRVGRGAPRRPARRRAGWST